MLKKLIFFILTCLSFYLPADISSNVGIQNNYINDKVHLKKNFFNEKIKDINLYDLGLSYALIFDSIAFNTALDFGRGSSHKAFLGSKEGKAKEKVLNYGFDLSYAFRMGPLSYGPKIGFDYNLQKIKSIKALSIEWYLPNIGLILKLIPKASYDWHLYTFYDFGLGRVKAHSPTAIYFQHQALRNRFSLGSYQKLFKNFFCDLYFIYSRETKHHECNSISRESFEGGFSLNYEF